MKRKTLARSDFEQAILHARKKGRGPRISGDAVGADISGLDLSDKAHIPGAAYLTKGLGYMIGIDLRNGTARSCNFRGQDISNANLRGVDFAGSDLSDCNLYNSLMQGADLGRVDLRGSNLVSAEFSDTIVAGANFEGATFGETTLINVDLSQARGLADALHNRSSAFDSLTFRRTAAGLSARPTPERGDFLAFLSRAGVDEALAQTVAGWIGKPIEYHSIFISHSSLDKEFARRIYTDLTAHGIRCWLDERQLLPGDSILARVDQGIKVWEKLLLVCSRNSLSPATGWWVEEEVNRCLAKERELRRTGVTEGAFIPVTIDDYVFTEWTGALRETVLARKIGDFRESSRYVDSLAELMASLDRSRSAF